MDIPFWIYVILSSLWYKVRVILLSDTGCIVGGDLREMRARILRLLHAVNPLIETM